MPPLSPAEASALIEVEDNTAKMVSDLTYTIGVVNDLPLHPAMVVNARFDLATAKTLIARALGNLLPDVILARKIIGSTSDGTETKTTVKATTGPASIHTIEPGD